MKRNNDEIHFSVKNHKWGHERRALESFVVRPVKLNVETSKH